MSSSPESYSTFDVRKPFGKRPLPLQDDAAAAAANKSCGSTPPTRSGSGHHHHPYMLPEKYDNTDRIVNDMFEKKFKYQRTEASTHWQLPPVAELFSEFYQYENLQKLREQLNFVKSKLNDYVIEEWSLHTRRNDPAGQLQWLVKNKIGVELGTVAWCKFYECLKQYPLVKGPKLNSLHLCEAPGAFIAALNHYLYSTYAREEVQWNWLASTLNPYYEGNALGKMIIDERFVFHTLDRWLFHANFTGNIIDRSNIENMQEKCAQLLDNEVHLITADGSIDCVETPDCQEEFVSLLHFAEICAALSILAANGCFVLKLFTLFEATSVSKMYLLNCVFQEVHVFKPATSRRGNSENYIICLGFRRAELPNFMATLELMKSKLSEEHQVMPMFRKSHIPQDFLLQHECCARRFMNLQINAIEANIYAFDMKSRAHMQRTDQLRKMVAYKFYNRYDIQPLPEELKILYHRNGSINEHIKTNMYKGSYTERQCRKDMTREEQIFAFLSAFNELEKSLDNSHEILLQETHERGTDQGQVLDLKLYRGAPYEHLRSSLFAAVHVLLKRYQLLDVFVDRDPLWIAEPKCDFYENSANSKETLKPTKTHALVVMENFCKTERNFMLNILRSMAKTKTLQKLVFTNYPFLTHFSVSILRFLAVNCFQELIITGDPHFTISLSTGAYEESSYFNKLSTLIDVLEKDSHVLICVDIKHLHRNEFSRSLVSYNNLLLLNNFKLLINSMMSTN